MRVGNSSDNHICNYCNNTIPPLTHKLQQHTTSSLWLKHGQCCAACIAPHDIKVVNEPIVIIDEDGKLNNEITLKKGTHRTNILLALSRVSHLEKMSAVKMLKRANRIILTGRLIGASGIAGALLFLYYEVFILSALFSFLGVVGIVICKIGVWKKYRIK